MARNLSPLNNQNLFLVQEYRDRQAGGLIILVPVGDDDMPDSTRPQLCFGWTVIQQIGKFEFPIPTSDPSVASGPLWLESLEKALDHLESDMRRAAIANASNLPPANDKHIVRP